MYNHYDSYWSELGLNLREECLQLIKDEKFDEWLAKVSNLKNTSNVSEFRPFQGSFQRVLDHGSVLLFNYQEFQSMKQALTFVKTSILNVFIEYAYVLCMEPWFFGAYHTLSSKPFGEWPLIPKWSPNSHHRFPSLTKQVIFLLLLGRHDPDSRLFEFPREILFLIFDFTWQASTIPLLDECFGCRKLCETVIKPSDFPFVPHCLECVYLCSGCSEYHSGEHCPKRQHLCDV
jgi:hypothetical protein